MKMFDVVRGVRTISTSLTRGYTGVTHPGPCMAADTRARASTMPIVPDSIETMKEQHLDVKSASANQVPPKNTDHVRVLPNGVSDWDLYKYCCLVSELYRVSVNVLVFAHDRCCGASGFDWRALCKWSLALSRSDCSRVVNAFNLSASLWSTVTFSIKAHLKKDSISHFGALVSKPSNNGSILTFHLSGPDLIRKVLKH